jgi:hypothetical protein
MVSFQVVPTDCDNWPVQLVDLAVLWLWLCPPGAPIPWLLLMPLVRLMPSLSDSLVV